MSRGYISGNRELKYLFVDGVNFPIRVLKKQQICVLYFQV